MSIRRRLGLVIVALPVAFYAYACSSDPSVTDGEDGGGGSEGGGNPGIDSSVGDKDSSTGSDSSTSKDSSVADAADASDGAVLGLCVGNPLTPDGGFVDGGVNLDASTTRQLPITFPIPVGVSFLDGPQFIDADGGQLIFSQTFSDPAQVLRVGGDGGAATVLRSGPVGQALIPIGNAFRNNVILTVVARTNVTALPIIWQTAPDGGALPSIDAGIATNPNDLVVGPNNNLYFTDPQYQEAATNPSVYRVLGDGGVQRVQGTLTRPNGIALSPDNTKLYVGLAPSLKDDGPTELAKRGVLVYTVAADGSIAGTGQPFLTAADLPDVPDGITVDVAGNLWIAEAAAVTGTNSGRVEVFSPTKQKLGTIPFPTKRPTGVAFGGTDNKTLYITTEDGVFVYASRCAGLR